MRFLLSFLSALLFSIGVAHAPLMTGRSFGGGVGWNGVYTLGNITPTTFAYVTGTTSGTTIGTATVAISPQAGFPTYSLSGANAGDFTINSSTGAISTNGSTPTCTSLTPITSINVVASQTGAIGTPVTQAITVNCENGPSTPTLIQKRILSANNGNSPTGNNFKFPLPNPTQLSDTLVLFFTYGHGFTVTSITDPVNGTWPKATSFVTNCDGGSGNTIIEAWVLPNTLAGAQSITINFNASLNPFSADFFEYSGVSTTSPVSGTAKCDLALAPNASTYVVTPSAFTPANNDANGGNLILNYMAYEAGYGASSPTSFTGASGYTLQEADIGWQQSTNTFPHAAQSLVQATAAATTPTLTATGDSADGYNSITLGLKTGAGWGGKVPTSGLYIIGVTDQTTGKTGETSLTSQFPNTQGNLRVILSPDNVFDADISGIAYSDSCAMHTITDSGTGDYPVIYYSQACSAGPANLIATISLTTARSNPQSYRFYDILNASASTLDGHAGNNLASTGSGTVVNMPSGLTCGNASDLTLVTAILGTGPGLAVTSPTGAVFMLGHYTGEIDGDQLWNADLESENYNSGTSAQSYTWTITNNGTGVNAQGACFK